MANTIVALYDDMDTAHKVVRDLRDAGFSNDRISLVAQDASGEYGKYATNATTIKAETSDGAATGAGVGAVVGGIGGLLIGLGALTIPGIGPVLAAGPLATAVAALLGAGAGAVAGSLAGGLLGALIDLGIPEEHAQYYAEGVRRGGALVTVEADDMSLEQARGVMNRFNPVDINKRVESWRQAGWKNYDANAKPFTAKQTMKDRTAYSTGQTSTYSVPHYARGASSMSDMERYQTGWRGHYQSQFASTGNKYEQYEPAYQYGMSLRNDPRYRDYDWMRLEPEARNTWDQRNPGTTWDQVKAAVRYSWENFKQAVRD